MSENLIDEPAQVEQPDRDELPAEAGAHADDAEPEDNNPEGLTNADVA